jgi:hypothetical protein
MSNINTMIDNWKLIIANDQTLKTWTQATYAKDPILYVGIDERDRPPDADYPCILLYPGRKSSGYQREAIEHIIGVSTAVQNAKREPYLKELPGLAEGTNSATLKTTADCTYNIAGVDYTKDITDNIAMTAAAEQAISIYCYYLISIDTTGAVTVTKGTDSTTAAEAAIAMPALPANSAPLGTILIQTDGSHTFTSGTTDLSAAGITKTIKDWNIKEYKGVKEGETFRQKVLSAISGMTDAQRGGRIDQVETEFAMIEFFPHFVTEMQLTITDDLYQGIDPVE